jgi:hypothetical protein
VLEIRRAEVRLPKARHAAEISAALLNLPTMRLVIRIVALLRNACRVIEFRSNCSFVAFPMRFGMAVALSLDSKILSI